MKEMSVDKGITFQNCRLYWPFVILNGTAKTKLATLAFLHCGEMMKNSITLFTFKSPLPPSCPSSITLQSLHRVPFHHPAQPPSCSVPSPCIAATMLRSITLHNLHNAPIHHPGQPPSCPFLSSCTAFSLSHSNTLHCLHPVPFHHPAQCPVPPPCMADNADISMNRL